MAAPRAQRKVFQSVPQSEKSRADLTVLQLEPCSVDRLEPVLVLLTVYLMDRHLVVRKASTTAAESGWRMVLQMVGKKALKKGLLKA